MTTLTITLWAVIGLVLAVYAWERWSFAKQRARMEVARSDRLPELPVAFGFKIGWFAVRATDPAAVAEAISLRNPKSMGWASGVEAAYGGRVFVTPPVDGWVLIASTQFVSLGEENDRWPQLLRELSEAFGEAQGFASHRVTEHHAWFRFLEGAEQRCVVFTGECGRYVSRGAVTPEEISLGLAALESEELERDGVQVPSESDVMRVAGCWSIAPDALEERDEPAAQGVIGDLK